ncbi:MAG: ferrous iron transport protein B [Treponema sp.]|jgi:ferrous iron transport protein B|nr:ferrous iron transport protein B [Treponema sp.]
MKGPALRIALAGNPNSGKTTLFNALTGAHHKVGNYPGVTVEKREGRLTRDGRDYCFTDLPGVYSLTAYSADEIAARDFILSEKPGERPDVIVDVLDSGNLERNLYLCLQFQELGIPVIGALNMTDEAEARGIVIDEKTLSRSLGIPLVKTIGTRGAGVKALLDCIDETVLGKAGSPLLLHRGKSVSYGAEIEPRLKALEDLIREDERFGEKISARWLAVKLLEKDANAFERLKGHADAGAVAARAREAALWIEKHFGKDSEIVISEQRYGYIRGAVRESARLIKGADFSFTDALDRVIMNRFLTLPIFVLVLWAMFRLTFFLGEYPVEWLEKFFGFLGGLCRNLLPPGPLNSLAADGVIGGVGGVFSFVPLIVILFFILSVLEDIGYMSRAAFATDRFLHTFGLHGQSVLPMMLGFGCSVPAVMAARTLKSPRDRIITVLVTPLMSCGAKLPVHALLAAAFFPRNAAGMVILVYGIGAALSLVCALVLRKTVLRGEAAPFVMELPPYRAPTLRGILWHVREKTWMYIKKAGTVILAASIFVWAITSFPAYAMGEGEKAELSAAFALENPGATEQKLAAYIENTAAGNALASSFAGQIGRAIEPVFRPLGFDWKIAVALVTGFAAKEVIVSTLGILYKAGAGEEVEELGLRDAIRKDSGMRPLAAFSLMLFTLIIPPCFAALTTIKAEVGPKWLVFEFAFLSCLGWLLCFAVYQIGSLVGYLA